MDLFFTIEGTFGSLLALGPLAGSRYPKSKITNISQRFMPACTSCLLQQKKRDDLPDACICHLGIQHDEFGFSAAFECCGIQDELAFFFFSCACAVAE